MSDDYRLEIGQITMQTEGGGIVHAEDEAFATEKVTYYAQVVNNTEQYLGPFEVHFLVDNHSIAWGGMSHQGVPAHESIWVHGYTDQLSVGNHTLHIKIEPGDTLFHGGEQTVDLNVLQPRSRRALGEGQEAHHTGWTQRQVYIFVRDFGGHGFRDAEAYVTFSGPGGEASERGTIVDGDLTLDNVWVPTEGNARLTVTTGQRSHPTIQGGIGYKVDGESLRLNFMQGKVVINEEWADSEEFNNKVGVTGSAGLDFKVFKAGLEVSYEHGWSETHSHSTAYEVWVPTEALEFAGDGAESARSR